MVRLLDQAWRLVVAPGAAGAKGPLLGAAGNTQAPLGPCRARQIPTTRGRRAEVVSLAAILDVASSTRRAKPSTSALPVAPAVWPRLCLAGNT